MPKRRKLKKQSLRKRLWPELSRLIRKRDGKCLMADDEFGVCKGVLQAAHLYPKGKYRYLELYPLNIVTLCLRHHFYEFPNNPFAVANCLRHKLGNTWTMNLLDEKNWKKEQRKKMNEEQIRQEWKECGLDGI